MDDRDLWNAAITALGSPATSPIGDLQHWQRCMVAIEALAERWTPDLTLDELASSLVGGSSLSPGQRLGLSDIIGNVGGKCSLDELPAAVEACIALVGLRQTASQDIVQLQWLRRLNRLQMAFRWVDRLSDEDVIAGNAVLSALGVGDEQMAVVRRVWETLAERQQASRTGGRKKLRAPAPIVFLPPEIDPPEESAALELIRCAEPDDREQISSLLDSLARRVSSVEGFLRTVQSSAPRSVDVNQGLGLVLTLLRKPNEAMEFIERSNLLVGGESALMRYLYVDCAIASGRLPERDTADLLGFGNWNPFDWDEDAHDGWIAELAEGDPFTQFEFSLLNRGIWVQLGKLSPLSEPESGRAVPQIPVNADALARLIVRESERTRDVIRTGNSALRHDVRELMDQTAFWIDRCAEMLPAQRAAGIRAELATTLASYGRLLPNAEREVIVAHYLRDDVGLAQREAVPAVIRCLALALEVQGRFGLGLGRDASLGDVCATLDDRQLGSYEWRERLRRLNWLRRLATHQPGGLTTAEAEEAWLIVFGIPDRHSGCLEELMMNLRG